MSERLSITPLGPYIGAQITGADLTRPLSDNQFEPTTGTPMSPLSTRRLPGRFWQQKSCHRPGETLYGPAELLLMRHCLSRFVSC